MPSRGKSPAMNEQAFLAQAKLFWAGELNGAAWRTETLVIAQDNFERASNLKLQRMMKSNS